MGFHACTLCKDGQKSTYDNMSSGDIILVFASGKKWQIPDMILHYMKDHGWMPPPEFVDCVLYQTLVGGSRYQTKSAGSGYFRIESDAEPIGYLTEAFWSNHVPEDLIIRLEQLMNEVNRHSGYMNVNYRVEDLNKTAMR